MLGEGRGGREGGETSGTSADPSAVKAGRPRSFSGADRVRLISSDRFPKNRLLRVRKHHADLGGKILAKAAKAAS